MEGDAININRVLTIGDTVTMEVLFHIQTPKIVLIFGPVLGLLTN